MGSETARRSGGETTILKTVIPNIQKEVGNINYMQDSRIETSE
jgi:hypothetical protein